MGGWVGRKREEAGAWYVIRMGTYLNVPLTVHKPHILELLQLPHIRRSRVRRRRKRRRRRSSTHPPTHSSQQGREIQRRRSSASLRRRRRRKERVGEATPHPPTHPSRQHTGALELEHRTHGVGVGHLLEELWVCGCVGGLIGWVDLRERKERGG